MLYFLVGLLVGVVVGLVVFTIVVCDEQVKSDGVINVCEVDGDTYLSLEVGSLNDIITKDKVTLDVHKRE